MPPPTSPIVAAWELALRLRQRREQLGMDARTVAQAMDFTRNYWSAVENERKLLSVESLTRISELFEFDNEERQELLELRTAAKERGWWTQYAMLSRDVQRLFGLEAGAHRIRVYESIFVTGLLQIADYARAIIASDVTVAEVETDERVEVRMKRQDRLSGDTPIRLTALISEAVLRQQIGGPAVLRRQLQHLAEMTEKHPDTIEILVIPFTATSCGMFGAATLSILDFPSPRLPAVVWQETVTARGIIEDPIEVRDITTTYSSALRVALSARDSAEMIRRHIKELT